MGTIKVPESSVLNNRGQQIYQRDKHSITGSYDGGACSAGGRGGGNAGSDVDRRSGSVGRSGRFIACIASISTTFFFNYLRYFL